MAATIDGKSRAAAAAAADDDDDLEQEEEEEGVVGRSSSSEMADQSTSSNLLPSPPPPHEIQTNSSSSTETTTSRDAASTLLLVVVVETAKAKNTTVETVDLLVLPKKKVEKNCRICQLSLEEEEEELDLELQTTNDDDGLGRRRGGGGGVPIIIELGCSCKDDLAAAHKHCAEAWFKIKGNKICEICGATARNLVGANETELLMEQCNEGNDTASAAATTTEMPAVAAAGTRNFWHGHRLLNLVLACVVFGFIISWFFHFNLPS